MNRLQPPVQSWLGMSSRQKTEGYNLVTIHVRKLWLIETKSDYYEFFVDANTSCC